MWTIYTKDEVERIALALSRILQLFQFPATRWAISLHTTIKLCVDYINHIKMTRKQTRIGENRMLRKSRWRKSLWRTFIGAFLRHPIIHHREIWRIDKITFTEYSQNHFHNEIVISVFDWLNSTNLCLYNGNSPSDSITIIIFFEICQMSEKVRYFVSI